MRVVAQLPAYPPKSRVGAFLATHDLLADLADRGHDVAVCQRFNHTATYTYDGVHVYPGKTTLQLETVMRDADVILAHLGDYKADRGVTPRLARRFGAKFVRIVHGHDPARYSRLTGADLVIFNSHHLAAEAAAWTGPSVIVHPPIRKLTFRRPGSRITLVNLSTEKGGELFWRLANKRPDLRFLGVKGGWGLQLTALPIKVPPNMEIVGPTEAMSDVYASTRILLMPSLRESWGMVALEAATCGIPTIAHPTLGLLESMGSAATYADRDDEAAWLTAIDRLQSAAAWETASAKAIAHVAGYDSQAELDRFATTIESLVSVTA